MQFDLSPAFLVDGLLCPLSRKDLELLATICTRSRAYLFTNSLEWFMLLEKRLSYFFLVRNNLIRNVEDGYVSYLIVGLEDMLVQGLGHDLLLDLFEGFWSHDQKSTSERCCLCFECSSSFSKDAAMRS